MEQSNKKPNVWLAILPAFIVPCWMVTNAAISGVHVWEHMGQMARKYHHAGPSWSGLVYIVVFVLITYGCAVMAIWQAIRFQRKQE